MLSVLEVLAIDDLRLPHVYFSSIFSLLSVLRSRIWLTDFYLEMSTPHLNSPITLIEISTIGRLHVELHLVR